MATFVGNNICAYCHKFFIFLDRHYCREKHSRDFKASLNTQRPASSAAALVIHDTNKVGLADMPHSAEDPSKDFCQHGQPAASDTGSLDMGQSCLENLELVLPSTQEADSVKQPFNIQVETFLASVLSANNLSKFLTLFRGGDAYLPSGTNEREVFKNIQTHSRAAEAFMHVDISRQVGLDKELSVAVHKDPIGLVKRMLELPDGNAVLKPTVVMDDDGQQRVYNEMWTADKWISDQVTWAKKSPIVYIMLWSDKMNYDKAGRQTGHPITISLGESKDSESFRTLKRKVLQVALEQVLKPFKQASYE
ncbi:hypothetical protein VOLCADRAFT_92571 [Volvox carteri f. nagariensis]|uniref:Uncharacterized protein n=1 Tax=Volvox carteri f. nagariensis TaxID=3068 RepID=D8U004_VOLCA|nr:uncharacterized protein VOLCADRAFT_92571 [Volvox carteri f. nagariensis]EFJ47097.1 hypothetical protein VOLCADRAFT_92571 [Volvox carteri f. nagariensis]|eukprot:XP_002951992.1 hypothetical protein VOLCADRAFT_92571 [Volvox carteri f. nagariensis]